MILYRENNHIPIYLMNIMYKEICILFFDDTKFLLKGLQRHFNLEFTCYIATSLEEADKILEENGINIVVADHQMPNNIGITLLKQLKDKKHMRKILTTSNRHSDLVLSLIDDGIIHAIVYTPLSRNVLKEELISQVKLLE